MVWWPQFREPSPGVAAEFIVTHGHEHHDRLLAQAEREKVQQLTGGFIGPVQVLENERRRLPGGQVGQDFEPQPWAPRAP